MVADLPLFAALTSREPSATSDVRAAHRLLSGPFSALAEALFESIERLQAEDPFRRVEVVVSSNYLAVDLRRRLAARIADAGRRAGHANVRFSTFLDVAREVAGDVAGKPAPPGILFAAVAGAVGAAPAVEPFRGLRHRPGFLRSVEATVRDLRDADVSVRQFSEWTATSPASRRESLEALADVYADVSRRLDPFADDVAVFRGAIRSAGMNPSKEPLLVFGFYDLTGMQRDLVAALAHARPLEVFLPEFEGDLGRFAEGTREFLEDILGPRQNAAPVTVTSAKSDWSSRFAGTGTGAKLPLAPDGSIRLVSAADDTDEAREIAREILRSHADGIPLAKTAVVLRQEEADSPRILAELARAGIPAFRLAGEANSKSPAGRAIRYWLQLEEDGFRREDVLDVLELVETARGGSNSALFRKLASQAGIVRGIEDWDRGTERLTRAWPEDEEDETEKRSGSAARTASGREAAEKLARTWSALRESATGWSDQPLSWARWAEELRGRIARLFAPQEPPEVISTAADSIASLDSAGQLVGKHVALETFLSALERQRVPGGRLGRDGVAVLSAMSARGLSFDHVLVPGLVERKFPAMARPDPLLSDEERNDVARATARPLAEKVFPRPDEERLLFAACADAALRRLTLLAARRDASLDRERTPSQFFTRAVDAFEGRPVETRDYSSGDRRPAALRATKLGAHGEERPALNATEARLRTLRVHGATTLALAFPPLARAREAARLRGRREYGPFEGRIRDPELLAGVWERLSESPLSPSAIETFAKCPYRFFFQRVLRVRAFDEASERGEVDDLGRGSLFHDAARRIAWERRGVAFRSLGAREASELSRRHAAEALGAWEEENGYGLGPALVRGLTEARLVEELEAWLRHERENPGAFAPAGAEVRFGPRRRGAVEDPELSTDEPLVCETWDGRILLAGRIDLVAVGEAGTLLRVTDFKVPRNLTTAGRIEKAAREKGQFVFSGELSQLPVYGLFAAEALCGPGGFPERIRAEYLYVGPSRSGGPVEVVPIGFDVEARGGLLEGFQNVLSTIETALREGVFRPRTKGFVAKEPCLFCDYKPICGPGHVKRYARKEDDRDPGVVALAGLEKIL